MILAQDIYNSFNNLILRNQERLNSFGSVEGMGESVSYFNSAIVTLSCLLIFITIVWALTGLGESIVVGLIRNPKETRKRYLHKPFTKMFKKCKAFLFGPIEDLLPDRHTTKHDK